MPGPIKLQQQAQPQQMPTTTTTTNGGPRVSFNRDVHVKRIGKRPNELPKYDYETTNLAGIQNYHQLPPDIDPVDIRKEAALVIAQAEKHNSKAQNGNNIPTFRLKQKRQSSGGGGGAPQDNSKKFHSLPTRRKGDKGKPVARSVSDAAERKKPAKRPSIFGLFSRKSDTNVSQLDRDPRFEDSGGRRLVRSKSDVGSNPGTTKDARNRLSKRAEAITNSKQQLSPIIEQSQREDYFEQNDNHFRNRERRKSDAVTVREKHESGLNELLARSRSQAEIDGPLLKDQRTTVNTSSSNNQPYPVNASTGISAGIRDRIESLQAKSSENMHSSQLPAERLPLTKGRTVDGLVKRLSMERFSPQPVISQPAFSYIRPNEGITYAQLDLSDEPPVSHLQQQQQPIRSSPARDVRTPMREFVPTRPPRANDKQQEYHGRSYSPVMNGGGRLNNSHSHSPSPWQQLSPRNLSDEDEGLGFEPRKVYYEERAERPAEPPIVPVIRSVSPAPYLDGLGYRRAQLENRIMTRRFGEGVTLERQPNYQTQRVYLSPERDVPIATDTRYHHQESPSRYVHDKVEPVSQSTSLPKAEKTSRYRHTKYYDDGRGGIKEVYVRETQTDGTGRPQVRESRHRERVGSTQREFNSMDRVIDHEPKSLDSQLTGTDQYRSSPELQQRFESSTEHHRAQMPQDYWQSSLKRDKLQQRSFDKGDSGIENDFRKESFNGDITTRWRPRTAIDNMKICETFLRKERSDSAQQQQLQRQRQQLPSRVRREHSYVYRERSIDDGSHYDPHLDKYPVATSTLRRREQQSQTPETSTLKRNKKLGGFEKVKQLFSGHSANGNGGSGRSSGSNVSSTKKDTLSRLTNGNSNSNSTLSRSKDKENDKSRDKERYMVREDEMRSRYREHHTTIEETSREPKSIDISMRRRLSTPKASPLLLKRSSADKSGKKHKETVVTSISTPPKSEKTSWFKSLDRRAKSSPKELTNVSVNGHSEATSSLKRTKRNAIAAPAKNLRFFGDTDLDSNPPTISKATGGIPRSRPPLAHTTSLQRTQKHSQSAYNLDRSPPTRDYRHTLAGQATSARQKSSSMQHLEPNTDEVDFRKRRHYSRSRELHDISESGSEPEPAERHKRSSAQRAMSLERSGEVPKRSNGALQGPPKPARSAERRALLTNGVDGSYSRERERYPAESSGTEGESSLHSQRSVVYLHATTVGDIPQPYNLRRRAISRDDLRKGSGAVKQEQPLQPMTRTVSRSVSMLAPWKPKHISEGYEINYSQEQNKTMATLPRKPPPHNGTSTSTLSRLSRNSETPTRRQNGYGYGKDETSTLRPANRPLFSSTNLRSAKMK